MHITLVVVHIDSSDLAATSGKCDRLLNNMRGLFASLEECEAYLIAVPSFVINLENVRRISLQCFLLSPVWRNVMQVSLPCRLCHQSRNLGIIS